MTKEYQDFLKRVEKKANWIELRFWWHDGSLLLYFICGIWFLIEHLSYWSIPVIICTALPFETLYRKANVENGKRMEEEIKAMRAEEYEKFEKR